MRAFGFAMREAGLQQQLRSATLEYIAEICAIRPSFDAAPDSPAEAIAGELPRPTVFRPIPAW